MQYIKKLSRRVINFLTKPSKQNDSYADEILAMKFDAKEAFNTVYFLVALILVSPFLEMDAKGDLHTRLAQISRKSPSVGTQIWKDNH